MRYTKYQYKKNKNGANFLTSVILMIVGAGAIGLLVGTIIFNTVWPSNSIKTTETSTDGATVQTNTTKEVFTTVQCGYFSKEENANKVLGSLGKTYNSFINKEDDKFRVLAGVFTEDEGEKALTDLKSKGIDAAKVTFTLNESDKVEAQISAIADAYFKIVSKLKDSEVKSLSTDEFKLWAKGLPEITEGDNKDSVIEFKKHIDQLPSELKKENMTDEIKYIYTILIKFKK